MEKIKNMLKPGAHKDDEVMYGDGQNTTTGAGTETQARKSSIADGGVGRQILNPSGEKYDEQAYGAAGTEGPSDVPLGPSSVQAVTGKKEHGVLRQIFNPHGDKYDEQAYGTTASKADIEAAPAQVDTGKNEHGIMRQLLNPAGDKYSEEAYGPSIGNEGTSDTALASSAAGGQGRKASVVDVDNMGELRTEPEVEKHEHGVLRQILNPHGKKYDEEAYGTTASEVGSAGVSGSEQGTTTGTSHLGRDAALGAGVGAVGGAGYEARKHHNDPAASSSTTATSSQPQGATVGQTSTERSFPLAGGATTTGSSVDPHSTGAETGALSGGSAIPDRTAQATDQSNIGRDAAVAGGVGAGALGAGAIASHDKTPAHDSTLPDIDRSSAFGSTNPTASDLVGGSSSTPYNTRDVANTSGTTAPVTSSTGVSSGDALGTADNSHLGRDAAIGAGAGAVGGAGLATYEKSRQPKQDTPSTTYNSSSQGIGGHHDDEQPDAGYVHHTRGPHATETANRLDPHVPGEFPTETGEDRHKLGNREAAVIGGTGLGAANLSNLSRDDPSATSSGLGSSAPAVASDPTTQQSQDKHLGRDAAIGTGAGLGAAGLGTAGYEATKSHEQPSQSLSGQPSASTAQPSTSGSQPLEQRFPESSQPIAESTKGYDNSATTSAAPISSAAATQPQDAQHHYGRDAALAGGAGVAGAGAYEASQSSNDTGLASTSGGPHDSRVANTIDPRIQSQPSTTTGHTTSTTSHVDPTSSQQPREQTHYGRDAAVAGGAGGVGAGAYEAVEHHDHPSQSTSGEHSHNKLHKKDDPRGPTGASAVIQDRHEHKLQEAREAEAAKHREHEGKEKKPSLIQRILHPGHHKHEHESTESSGNVASPTSAVDTDTPTSRTQIGNDPYQATPSATSGLGQTSADQQQEGIVTEPHTGLPMNVGKYGTGQGGTDGTSNIGGYNQSAPGETSADWDKIKKANTPY